jgi:hypothetical protein
MDKDEKQAAREALAAECEIADPVANNVKWKESAAARAEKGRSDIADADEEDRAVKGRVTNRDLWLLSASVNDRCSSLERAQANALEHIDIGFDDLRSNMRDLRGVVNEQLHAQDEHIDTLAKAVETLRSLVAPMRARWDVKNALLKGSWKLTGAMIGVTGIVTGIIAHYGLYTAFWDWCH